MDVNAATRKRLKAERMARARSTASSSFRVISLDDGIEHPGSGPEQPEEELAQMDLDLKLFVDPDGVPKSGDQVMELTEHLLKIVTEHVLDHIKEKIVERRDGGVFPAIAIDEADALYSNLDERFSRCDSGMREKCAKIVKELPSPLLQLQYNDIARYLRVVEECIGAAALEVQREKGRAQKRYKLEHMTKPSYENDKYLA